MKPNTPTKMTMISHITYWCRWSISCAIDEAADGKYHARACALVAPNAAARPPSARRSFEPFILFFPPNLDPQPFLELHGERGARLVVEMPPELERLPAAAQHDVPAVAFDTHRAGVELVARDTRGLRHLDGEPPAVELDALIVGGVARLQQERGGEQQHLEAGERQDEPRAGECEAGADRQRRDAERGENASQARRRDRAIALEDHAEAARALMERQLAPRIFPRRLEGGHAH